MKNVEIMFSHCSMPAWCERDVKDLLRYDYMSFNEAAAVGLIGRFGRQCDGTPPVQQATEWWLGLPHEVRQMAIEEGNVYVKELSELARVWRGRFLDAGYWIRLRNELQSIIFLASGSLEASPLQKRLRELDLAAASVYAAWETERRGDPRLSAVAAGPDAWWPVGVKNP